jgi:hypothetical protein
MRLINKNMMGSNWKSVARLLLLVASVFLMVPGAVKVAYAAPLKNALVAEKPTKSSTELISVHPIRLTLESLAVNEPVKLASRDGQRSVGFSFHTLDVISKVRVHLRMSYSPLLDPEKSSIKILLNGKVAGQRGLDKFAPNDGTVDFDVDPLLLTEWNYLTYQIDGHLLKPCDDPRDPAIWLLINNKESFIEADATTLPMGNDLSFFPVPFFDKHDTKDLRLPIVFSGKPNASLLQSAGILTSWFGALSTWRKAEFPVSFNTIPDADAIVLVTSADHIDGLSWPAVNEGSVISIIVNPVNPSKRLFLVVGHTEKDLLVAAQTIVLGKVPLEGESQAIGSTVELPKRVAMDAPNWLKKNSKVALGSLVKPEELLLQGWFVSPLSLNANFPPNLFRSGYTTIPVNLNLSSSNKGRYLNKVVSFINGVLFSTIKLEKNEADYAAKKMTKHNLHLDIPTVNLTGKDNIRFEFTFADGELVICPVDPTYDYITIDPNSMIDLASLPEFVELANLSYFAYSGFPYSKMADLSETVIAIPNDPTQFEIESLLTILGHIGNKSGYPGTRVTVGSFAEVVAEKNKDVIVIGSDARVSELHDKWASYLPVDETKKYQPWPNIGYDYVKRWENWSNMSALLKIKDSHHGIFSGFGLPSSDSRTVLMLTSDTQAGLETSLSVITSWNRAKDFIGDVTLIDTKGETSTFQILKKYSIGSLPLEIIGRRLMTHNPWISVLAGFIFALLFAALGFRRLDKIAHDRIRNWK